MKIGGIIAEYNPYHNGHAFQVSQVHKECDAVVAVMSGSVAQRGMLTVYDKFIRSRAAVSGGVDLVIELPCVYTLAPAELFAQGAVALLDSLGVVDKLYFGSECGDTQSLTRAAQIMLEETPEISLRIKENLKAGMGYRAAQLAAYIGTIPTELINRPNNILGIEYIKAMLRAKSKMEPVALLRKFVNHNDTSPSNGYASGNAIRDILDTGNTIFAYVPTQTHYIYRTAAPFDKKILDSIILYMLRIRGMKVFDTVFDAPPEMVARILYAIPEATSLDDIIMYTHTKQYTKARIRRAIMSALLEIDGELVNTPPQYIRVLAFNDKGREILAEIKKKTKLPVITKTADYKEKSPLFAAEVRATELSSICRGFRRGLDYTNSPAYVTAEDLEIAVKGNAAKKDESAKKSGKGKQEKAKPAQNGKAKPQSKKTASKKTPPKKETPKKETSAKENKDTAAKKQQNDKK